ncbi:MAG: hypothetical protein JWL80_35 [Parcubacteria group bacterium]|nr:hypothetical protein [Parcubacteria group bacterium]
MSEKPFVQEASHELIQRDKLMLESLGLTNEIKSIVNSLNVQSEDAINESKIPELEKRLAAIDREIAALDIEQDRKA